MDTDPSSDSPASGAGATSPWARGGPAPSAGGGPVDPLARGRQARRITDQLTVVILVATAAAVLAAAGPVIGRALAPEPPVAAREGIARIMRARGYATGPERRSADRASARTVADDVLEGLDPLGASTVTIPPGHPSLEPLERLRREAMRGHDEPSEAGAEGSRIQVGVANGETVLYARPELGSPVVGEAPAGQLLLIGARRGAWVLAAFVGEHGTVLGWVEQSHVVMP